MTILSPTCYCIRDPWLSGVLNRTVYKVLVKDTKSISHEERKNAVLLEQGLRDSPVFIYANIPSTDVHAFMYFTRVGFYCVESRLVFEKQRQEGGIPRLDNFTLRCALPEDENDVRWIAQISFTYSRFHCDPKFSLFEASALKEAWASNFFVGGRGTHMIVAVHQDRCVGFLLLIAQRDVLIIDLIAVAPEYQNRGVAAAMITYAEHIYTGTNRIRVGTQAANIPSVRLYKRIGFRLVASQYILHYHN